MLLFNRKQNYYEKKNESQTLTSISQKQDFQSVNTLHIYFYTLYLFLAFIFYIFSLVTFKFLSKLYNLL